MVSFATLWEQMDRDKARKSPLLSSGDDDRALVVLRAGKELHDEESTSFWDEFISLCGNADGLSELLGIPSHQIRTWPGKIEEGLDKLQSNTATTPSEKENAEMLPTGENGAFVTNQDPKNIGDFT
jgi:hypothetical protein